MPRYTVTEPHPTVVQNGYTHSGRGGAGNYFRAPVTTPASGVATAPSAPKTSTTRFYSGRGGAGNAHATENRPTLSFDEEFARQSHMEAKALGHVGRGGAGNIFSDDSASTRRKASDASSHKSGSSSSSGRSGLFARLTNPISHH